MTISLYALLIVFAVALLAAMLYFLVRPRKRTTKGKDDAHSVPMSAFSAFDDIATPALEESVGPIGEAELYVTYGRRKDAERILEEAVRRGRISEDERQQFWDKHAEPSAADR